MKMSRPFSPILTLKLAAMATSLKRSEKGGHIGNIPSIPITNWVKIGPMDPEMIYLKGLF